MDFFDILKEAKNPKSAKPSNKKNIKIEDDSLDKTTDYSSDVDNNKKDTSTNDNINKNDETTDYTLTDDDSEDTDYTSEDVQKEPIDTPDDDNPDGTSDDTTDYTDENTNSDEDGTEDNSDLTDENSDVNITDKEKNKSLLKDYLDLYYLTKNTVVKLSNLDKSDIILNKVSTQVISNLNIIQKQLFNFIIYKFSKNNYINNLYQYNYFIEAFRINIEMVKKISFFVTNKQNKYIKNQ